jgi:hypothetical protein
MNQHAARCIVLLLFVLPVAPLAAQQADPQGVEFFEKKIRPVLAEHCYKCHSTQSKEVKGGLLLDTRDGIRKGGETGHGVIPGNVDDSLVIQALRHESFEMPPKEKLPDALVADFVTWVKMGAPDPRDGVATMIRREINFNEARTFWSFQPVQKHSPPQVKAASWPRGDIDRFVLARMEQAGLKPVADVDRRALIRRIYFDLIGLPPSPEAIDAFVNDKSPQAVEHLIDGLLDSPQFGERWGRHWLDVARYAESNGRERNYVYPYAWRYRDYVIASFNADKPYDRFISEQIAGDLLPYESDEQLIATGFLAIGPKLLNERDREVFRMDMVDEQVDVTTRAVMALTVSCARCHDHKFDPIPTKEYYALAGIFRSTETLYGTANQQGNRQATKLMTLAGGSIPDADKAKVQELTQQLQAARSELANLQGTATTTGDAPAAPKPAKANKKKAAAEGKKVAKVANEAAVSSGDPKQQQLVAQMQAKVEKLDAELNQLTKKSPGAPQVAMGVQDGQIDDCPIYHRGEVTNRGEVVPRGYLTILSKDQPEKVTGSGSGRLDVARWLTSVDNPLTSRVMVNRIWQHLFGQGLVRSVDNFGTSGEQPSHPELLDHLAGRFVEQGWSVKSMIREIMLSRSYQLSSNFDGKNYQADPDNILLWRMNQRRLDAESLRDAMLSASGQLDLTPLDGSVAQKIGDGEVGRGVSEAQLQVSSNRRSVYLPILRNAVPDSLQVFDFAEPSIIVGQRDVTTVPTQALYMMNSPFVIEQSDRMASRLLSNASLDDTGRTELAYQLVLSRRPNAAELERAGRFVGQSLERLQKSESDSSKRQVFAWSGLCQALFASAEFRYLD